MFKLMLLSCLIFSLLHGSSAGEDGIQPDPQRWKIVSPEANFRATVTLTFDEPLDHSLLARVVRILDASRSEVAGKISVLEHETVWSFETKEQDDQVIGAVESELSIAFDVSK